jgi:hypothetical protein
MSWWKKLNKVVCFTNIDKCNYATTNFDLWMLKGTHDIFARVMNFLGANN